MKLTVFLLVISLFQLRAGTGYAQKAKITLDMQGVSVTKVIEKIEDITEFDFLYRPYDLDLERKVSIKVRKQKIEEILHILFNNSEVNFNIRDKLIILSKKGITPNNNTAPEPKEKTELNQQQFEVNGTITDPEGNPLPGVNIIIKGTNQGTMSDPDGRYTILVQTNDLLTFSYVGYKKLELPIDGPDTIDIQMEEDVTSLEGVEVNAGYWKVKEKERTGNISRLTSEEISSQPVSNVIAAAIGRMSGVNIIQNTGVPGGSFQIEIRGRNSIAAGNNPLYVVDGVPFTSTPLGSVGTTINGGSPLNSINPADIESIEVLKDADATAIYGSRGANGVVLITTKKGRSRKGKTTLDINMYSGVGKVSSTMDLLNTEQYLEMRKEAFANDEATPTEVNAPDLLLWDQNRYTDWQKELIGGTAFITDIQASVSGGNDQTSFRFGGGWRDETTVYPDNFGYKKVSGHFNLNHISKDRKFTLAFSASYVTDKNNLMQSDITRIALTLSPNAPEIFNVDGTLNWKDNFNNPLNLLLQGFKATTDNFIVNSVVNYQVSPELQLRTNLGYTTIKMDQTTTFPQKAFSPNSSSTSRSNFTDRSVRTWIIEPQIEYKKIIGDGKLSVLLGTTFQQEVSEAVLLRATGFSDDTLLENINNASDISVLNGGYHKNYRYHAIFGRIHYNWKEKYLINLTARRDGSSRFGPGKRFGNFGAIGVAWIFSEEPFVKKGLPFLSFGKFRASYGVTGNDQIPDYQYLDTYTPTANSYQETGGLYPTRLFNPDFAWETNKKLEAALQFSLLSDRINLGVSWYRNRSSDQLVGFGLPWITGFNTIQSNLPALVENTGWELELQTTNIKSENFVWASSVNLTFPRNKLVAYPDIENSPFATTYAVGQSLNIVKAYHATGVDPQTGLYTFEDVDGDGNISFPNDLQAIKEVAPDFFGGFQNSFSYKNWQLDVFFQIVKQTGITYMNAFNPFYFPGYLSNQPLEVLNRWQNPGDVSNIQKFTQEFGEVYSTWSNNAGNSDNRIGDASFIRLKNVSLSYQLPIEKISGIPFYHGRVYIQGQNLFTFTNYVGLDPENHGFTALPPLRVITAGIQLTF